MSYPPGTDPRPTRTYVNVVCAKCGATRKVICETELGSSVLIPEACPEIIYEPQGEGRIVEEVPSECGGALIPEGDFIED